MATADTKVPLSAAWLGGLGALPFIALAGATPFLAAGPLSLAAEALVAYGATILSFLGGIHWGLAIAPEGGATQARLQPRLILSVIPSLAAWAALLVADTIGLFILALAVAAMLWVDLGATRTGEAPPWYPNLRIPLTCIVVAALLLGAFFSQREIDRSHSIDNGVSSAKSAAHQSNHFVRSHLEVTFATEALYQFLSTRLVGSAGSRLDQIDNAILNFELDRHPRQKLSPLTHILWDGHLASGIDPHGKDLSDGLA
jgi:hypothetical protein